MSGDQEERVIDADAQAQHGAQSGCDVWDEDEVCDDLDPG